MATNYTTPNLGLIIPVPGSEPGPNWANDINASLTILDAHTHTSGSGVLITPSAININGPLPMNGYALSGVGTVLFATQSSTPANLNLYVNSPDLFYVDGNGNNVKLTSGGLVNATSSGISSGAASASFAGGVLVVDSAVNTPGNIQAGSILIGNNVASSNFVTLSAANALASSYSLVLPAIPSQTDVITLDTSGNFGSITYDAIGQAMTSVGANAIAATMTSTGTNSIIATMGTAGANSIASNMNATGANAIVNKITSINSGPANTIIEATTRATGNSVGLNGVASASITSFSTSSATYTTVTGSSLTITTSGRPVMLVFTSNNTGNQGSMVTALTNLGSLRLANTAAFGLAFDAGATARYLNTFSAIIFPGAGTFTWAVDVACGASGYIIMAYMSFYAYEL